MGSSFTTVKSPNIDAWATSPSAMLLTDMHSGGTVCSPTRSSVLTYGATAPTSPNFAIRRVYFVPGLNPRVWCCP